LESFPNTNRNRSGNVDSPKDQPMADNVLPNVATNIASPQRKDVDVINETDDDDEDTYMQSQILIEGSETELQLPAAATAQASDGAVTTQTKNNGVRLLNTQTQEEINKWMNSALN
jgi:rRNA maturation endonuclease Nob1